MSDLLVVVPTGWTDVTEGWNASSASLSEIMPLVQDSNWADVTTVLQGADINIPEGMTLTGASFMTLDDGVHLWIRYI